MRKQRQRFRTEDAGPGNGDGDAAQQIIGTTKAVEQLVETLSGADFLAVDTEFMREHTYYAKLCLIQVSDGTTAAAIDPLAPDIDLGSFWRLMANKNITKVFHAAGQDVEIMLHEMNALPLPVFDSQIASMVLGHGDQIGYDNLVKRVLDIEVDKSSRFTDWARRPLSEKQISYALGDVIYLAQMYPKLLEQLESSGRAHWLEEEYTKLTDVDSYIVKPENAWKRVTKKPLKPDAQRRLEHLAAWREHAAQTRDIPRGRMVKDDTLINLATVDPKRIDELDGIRNFPGGANGKLAPIVIRELAKVREEKPKPEAPGGDVADQRGGGERKPGEQGEPRAARPKRRKPPVAVLDMLRVLLKHVTDKHGIAPRLVANASELEALACDDNARVRAQNGWRHEIFGETALRLKRGEIALAADGDRVTIIERGDGDPAGNDKGESPGD